MIPILIKDAQCYTEEIKIRKESTLVNGATWYLPWTWFSTKKKAVDENQDFVNIGAMMRAAQKSLDGRFTKTSENFIAYADNTIKQICDKAKNEMDALDVKIEKLLKNLDAKAEDTTSVG